MDIEESNTSEKIIVTKRGNYGRIQVTLPMTVKTSMMNWMRNSGIGKAEFFRMALMIGAIKLADDVRAKESNEGFNQKGIEELKEPART